MRPSTLIEVITNVSTTGQPVYVWGKPGIGKSACINQAAQRRGIGFADVRVALLDPVDVRGLPTIENGITKWAPPEFLPRTGSGLLFLDELAQGAPMIQAAMLQLCLERRVGEYVLPDGWTIVAASNRQEDRAGGHRVISPLLNRFLHLDLEVHNDDWQAWALPAGVAPEVRSFLNARPALLHKFDANANERSFPTPRSWEFVSRILPTTTDATIFDLVSGCVGQGPAAEFVAFYKVYASLPDVNAILASPKTAPVPSQPDVLYAVCGAVVDKVRLDLKKGGNGVEYCSRLPKEFGVLMFRDLIKLNKQLLVTNAGREFLTANRDALIAS
jgi:hypothetical protein